MCPSQELKLYPCQMQQEQHALQVWQVCAIAVLVCNTVASCSTHGQALQWRCRQHSRRSQGALRTSDDLLLNITKPVAQDQRHTAMKSSNKPASASLSKQHALHVQPLMLTFHVRCHCLQACAAPDDLLPAIQAMDASQFSKYKHGSPAGIIQHLDKLVGLA